MTEASDYDTGLTDRIRAEIERLGDPADREPSELARLLGRLTGEFRHLLSDPGERGRTLEFLEARPAAGSTAAGGPGTPSGPVRRTLRELGELSSRLDRTTDPSEGFVTAETVARRTHEIGRLLEGLSSALDPADAITDAFHRLAALVSRLLRNAVARLKAFGALLGVTSFSIAFAVPPPQVWLTFNFGKT